MRGALLLLLLLPALASLLPLRAESESLSDIAARAQPGVLGAAVLDLKTGAVHSVNGTRPFPMASVFKAPLAAAILARVDAQELTLDQSVTLEWNDARDGVGPVDGSGGGVFTLRDLLQAMLIQSDNTAADLLLPLAGGPQGVTDWLKRHGFDGLRVDRDERTIARDGNGIPPDLFPGRNASTLRGQVKTDDRRAAFAAALDDPRDTATPEGMVRFLAALQQGKLLSGGSTRRMLEWMKACATGPHRLRAGTPPKAVVADKTGTGMAFEGITLATNDVGIVTLPDGRVFAVAAFLQGSGFPEQTREGILAAVARAASAAPAKN